MAVLTRGLRASVVAIQAAAVLLGMVGCAAAPSGRSAGARVAQAYWCERAAPDPVEQVRAGLDTMGLVRWEAGRWWLAEPRCAAPPEWLGRQEPRDGPTEAGAPSGARAAAPSAPSVGRPAWPVPPPITVVPLGPARRVAGATPAATGRD